MARNLNIQSEKGKENVTDKERTTFMRDDSFTTFTNPLKYQINFIFKMNLQYKKSHQKYKEKTEFPSSSYDYCYYMILLVLLLLCLLTSLHSLELNCSPSIFY